MKNARLLTVSVARNEWRTDSMNRVADEHFEAAPKLTDQALPVAVMLAQVWMIAKFGKRGFRAKRSRKQVVEHRRPMVGAMLPTTTTNELNDSRCRNVPAVCLPVSRHARRCSSGLAHSLPAGMLLSPP